MEDSRHLKYFKVENFKCFDSFEMNDIGQFNLIVGDNDVGKTTLLEALLIDEISEIFLPRLRLAHNERNKVKFDFDQNHPFLNYLKYYLNNKSVKNIIKYIIDKVPHEIKISEINKLKNDEVEFLNKKPIVSNLSKQVYIHRIKGEIQEIIFPNHTIDYAPFIPFGLGYGDDLVKFYESIQESESERKQFISDVKKLFIHDIKDVFIHQNSLFIRLSNLDKIVPLSMYGSGVVRLFRILMGITKERGERLMIDEIDIGIHYSRSKQFWKTIIKSASAKINNVQLFATTHNLECLKYFKEALQDDDMAEYQKDARLFLIDRLPDGRTKAYNYSFDQFESAIELGNEIRGGD